MLGDEAEPGGCRNCLGARVHFKLAKDRLKVMVNGLWK